MEQMEYVGGTTLNGFCKLKNTCVEFENILQIIESLRNFASSPFVLICCHSKVIWLLIGSLQESL